MGLRPENEVEAIRNVLSKYDEKRLAFGMFNIIASLCKAFGIDPDDFARESQKFLGEDTRYAAEAIVKVNRAGMYQQGLNDLDDGIGESDEYTGSD